MSHLRFCRTTLTRDKVAACDFICCDFDAACDKQTWSHVCLLHAASKLQSHAATLSRVRVARQNRWCDMALKTRLFHESFPTQTARFHQDSNRPVFISSSLSSIFLYCSLRQTKPARPIHASFKHLNTRYRIVWNFACSAFIVRGERLLVDANYSHIDDSRMMSPVMNGAATSLGGRQKFRLASQNCRLTPADPKFLRLRFGFMKSSLEKRLTSLAQDLAPRKREDGSVWYMHNSLPTGCIRKWCQNTNHYKST